MGWTLRSALQPNTSRRVTGRLEALATWIEALRDSVAAHRGLLAAIESTVHTAPTGDPGTTSAALVVRIKSGSRPRCGALHLRRRAGRCRRRRGYRPARSWPARFGGSDLQSLLATAAANTRDQIALVAAHRDGPGPSPGGTCAW